MGAISLLSSFNTIGGIESGPEVLWDFKLSKSFLTAGVEISIWSIEGKELSPLSCIDLGKGGVLE